MFISSSLFLTVFTENPTFYFIYFIYGLCTAVFHAVLYCPGAGKGYNATMLPKLQTTPTHAAGNAVDQALLSHAFYSFFAAHGVQVR